MKNYEISPSITASLDQPFSPASAVAKHRTLWSLRVEQVCLAIASAAAGYLLYYALSHGAVGGCGPGSGCDLVLGSPWAYVLHLPISGLALVLYLGLLVGSFLAGNSRLGPMETPLSLLMVAGAVLVLGAGLWFTVLQWLVLKSICKFCTLAHVCGGLASILVLRRILVSARIASGAIEVPPIILPLPLRRAIARAVFLLGGLIALQTLFPYQPSLIRDYIGQTNYNPSAVPVIGSPEAPHKIISLFDYTCPHCRLLHQDLFRAKEYFNEQVAIVALPVPLCSKCNPFVLLTPAMHEQACEYARLGLALWRSDRQSFARFDTWIFGLAALPSVENARQYAAELVGRPRLKQALADAWVDNMLKTDVALYQETSRRTHSTRLPQLIVGREIVVNPVLSYNDLLNLLQTTLQIKPRSYGP